jgi:hypothetical protein
MCRTGRTSQFLLLQEFPLHHIQLFKFPCLMMSRRVREEFLRLYPCCRQDIHKKGRREEERRIMTLGVSSGGSTDTEFGFSDDETDEVSLEVHRTEEDLEGARVTCSSELHKEDTLSFSEYKNYNRIQFTTNNGWDQYLPRCSRSSRICCGVTPSGSRNPCKKKGDDVYQFDRLFIRFVTTRTILTVCLQTQPSLHTLVRTKSCP